MNYTREKIEKLFAESVYEVFKTERYGIKSCKKTLDPSCLLGVRDLYIAKKERYDCDLDSTDCSYKKITELINTL